MVDLVRRVVDVYAATGSGWARLARLTARGPCATVEVTGLGPIELSLAEILGMTAEPLLSRAPRRTTAARLPPWP